MNGPDQQNYLSVRHANAVLDGRTVRNTETGREATILAVSIKADGRPDEFFIRSGDQSPEWVEAEKWTVVQ